jgi:hypothetical protein
MTSVTIQHVAAPSSARDARTFHRARDRAADGLAGRTVWCATALPAGRGAARSLRERLGSGGGVTAGSLDVPATEPLRDLAGRLDAVLRLAVAAASPIAAEAGTRLGAAERDVYARAQRDGEAMLGSAVSPNDVVVLHDALTAVLAQAVRERGAHVVWDVMLGAAPGHATAHDAWTFLRPYTSAIDAFVMSWLERDPRGRPVERIAAVMPSADIVATQEIPTGEAGGDPCQTVGWSSVLADVVDQDRGEHVGGTLHARPAVAVR